MVVCMDEIITQVTRWMQEDEKSSATREKYTRDIAAFLEFVGEGNPITKDAVIAYKGSMQGCYKAASINSRISSVNYFLRRAGQENCRVRNLRIQRQAFRSDEKLLTKEEYWKLLNTASDMGRERMRLVMETICATGIRVSELQYITVEAVRQGKAVIQMKGKNRMILIPDALCRDLAAYIASHGIRTGSVFVTKSGRPLERTNIYRDMKQIAEIAGVPGEKVFPHNLRHLFAFTYYRKEKDLCALADLLGHSDINTTRIYTAGSSVEQREKLNGLGLM